MKKKQKSLWLSGISLATCIAMLAGTTFAWFSDTVTSNGNVITAGTLDITVTAQDLTSTADTDNVSTTLTTKYAIDGDLYGEKVTYELIASKEETIDLATTPNALISNDNWEPGCVDAKLITVKNDGSLATKISINAVVHDKELQDALWVDLYNVTDGGTGKFNPVPMSKLSDGLATRDANILEKEEFFQVIAIYGMNESAGNEYQEKSFSADLQFVATQATFEEDGLGRDDYDAEAVEDVVTVATADELAAQIARVNGTQENPETQLLNGTIVLIDDITVTGAITLNNLVNFDLNGYTLTCPSFSMKSDSTETVDFANGKLVATTGNVEILVGNGSVNVNSVTNLVKEGNTVTYNATTNTLTLSGTTEVKKLDDTTMTAVANGKTTVEEVVAEAKVVAPVIMANTRVVVATTTDTTIQVSSNVTVEDQRETSVETTVTVTVPADTTGVVIDNSSQTNNDIVTDGAGKDDVENLTDGEVVLSAEEIAANEIGIAAGFAGGDGSEAYPFQISSQAELENITSQMIDHTKVTYFIQTEDITIEGTIRPLGIAIAPITNTETAFALYGGYDGNNKTIYDLTIDESNTNKPAGLFANVAGIVKNVNLVNCDITGNTSASLGSIAGALSVGNPIEITNCTVEGNLTGGTETGGIFGYIASGTYVITNCKVDATITGETYVGGIVGKSIDKKQSITDCTVSGELQGGGTMGSICGYSFFKDGLTITDEDVSGLSNTELALIGDSYM